MSFLAAEPQNEIFSLFDSEVSSARSMAFPKSTKASSENPTQYLLDLEQLGFDNTKLSGLTSQCFHGGRDRKGENCETKYYDHLN